MGFIKMLKTAFELMGVIYCIDVMYNYYRGLKKNKKDIEYIDIV